VKSNAEREGRGLLWAPSESAQQVIRKPTPMEQINSSDNATLKLARKLLRSSRERARSGKILLDGVHLVRSYEASFGLASAIVLVNEMATKTREIASLTRAVPSGARVAVVESDLFARLSPVDTPSGIVALCEQPHIRPSETASPFQLLLDGIQDPGNLGSILRTAAATGVNQVLLSKTCTDPWSPKSLRGGMGAQFVVPITTDVDPRSAMSSFQGITVATSPHSERSLIGADLSGPVLAIFGGESAGLCRELTDSATMAVKIPLKNSMESLNVGAAVAMLCYERVRQTET
jgi:RNA methyltransferase, TrmH family